MSAVRVPLSEARYSSSSESTHAQQPQIVFTRQLWERTMPATDDEDDDDNNNKGSINNEHNKASRSNSQIRQTSIIGEPLLDSSTTASKPRTLPASISIPHPLQNRHHHQQHQHQHQPSPTHSLRETPLTPEESPPFRSSIGGSGRKRSASNLDHDESPEGSPLHVRGSSGDSSISFCLCQPEPKVPRPRNAFILYRQNHQAAVVSQNPGLANPDISKIIGEQWRNEPEEEKNRWKAYAEEEKLHHQQRFPSYRYQPKRAGRRSSVSSDSGQFSTSGPRKCAKCGGRSIINPTPSTPSSAKEKYDKLAGSEASPSTTYALPPRANTFQLPPPTPSSTTTPSTRYLPMLNNLSLNSPHARRMAQSRGHPQFTSPQPTAEERSPPPPPVSSDPKRRRFESPQGTYVMSTRVMPPRQSTGPGTPFPFPQQSQQPQMHLYSTGSQIRRESLPPASEILRGRPNPSGGPPSTMGPPPRPNVGYSQHRLSQGHVRPPGGELSLVLPPLQTVNVPRGPSTGRLASGHVSNNSASIESAKEADNRGLADIIMSMPFQHKIGILRRIAPPLAQGDSRVPRPTIIAIEADDTIAACKLTDWLEESLGREGDMNVRVIDGPMLPQAAQGSELHVQDLLRTVLEWQDKNHEVVELLKHDESARRDSVNSIPVTRNADNVPAVHEEDAQQASEAGPSRQVTKETAAEDESMMDVDDSSQATIAGPKSVILFRTYTLTASNAYAAGIPITDVYRPDDHWQWTATLWRGTVGPDVTVYIKDVDASTSAARDEPGKGGVEMVDDTKSNSRYMAIRRTCNADDKTEKGGLEGIEAGTLRRLGFEVGEWIRSTASSRGSLGRRT